MLYTDGGHIVFSSKQPVDENDSEPNYNIFIANADGTDIDTVTTDHIHDNIHPTFLSGGAEVAFTSYYPAYDEDPFATFANIAFKIYRNTAAGAFARNNGAVGALSLGSWEVEFASHGIHEAQELAIALQQGTDPTPTSTPSLTPTPIQTSTPIPRDVSPQALAFHSHAQAFGLPLPFDIWPVQDFSSITYKQGYGPTWFAYSAEPPPYQGTHQIHNGIDFASATNSKEVVAGCNGVLIGRKTTGFATGYGVTLRCFSDDPVDPDDDGNYNLSNIVVAYNHLDLVGRIAISSSSPYVVVYAGETLGFTHRYYPSKSAGQICSSSDGQEGDCTIVDPIHVTLKTLNGETVSYDVGQCTDSFVGNGGNNECSAAPFRFCPLESDGISGDCIIPIVEDVVEVNGRTLADIVGESGQLNYDYIFDTTQPTYQLRSKGEGLACIDSAGDNECLDSSGDHLHFEMFIARGYNSGNNAVLIDPLLMFTNSKVNDFTFTAPFNPERPTFPHFEHYFPVNTYDPQSTVPTLLGLEAGNLDAFSLDANLKDTNPSTYGFFQIQTPTPVGIPEWWLLQGSPPVYPNQDRMLPDIVSFLTTYGYSQTYKCVGPNCTNLPITIGINQAGLSCDLDQDRNDVGSMGTNVNDINSPSVDAWEPLRPDLWPYNTP